MPGYFYCRCCGKRIGRNPRLKIKQLYCGNPICQKARKNFWERERIKEDAEYRQKRLTQKAAWRKHRPGHEYQRDYRKETPGYVELNRKQQQMRNKSALKADPGVCTGDIVKTDALFAGSVVCSGIYELLPYKTGRGKKIVKTDTLLVEIRAQRGLQKFLPELSG